MLYLVLHKEVVDLIVGTTPTHTFEVEFDVSLISKVRVLYSQDDEIKITKTQDDCVLKDNIIEVTLTQEDTFKLDHSKNVEIQIRVLTTGNDALSSIPYKVGIIKCLETEVLV